MMHKQKQSKNVTLDVLPQNIFAGNNEHDWLSEFDQKFSRVNLSDSDASSSSTPSTKDSERPTLRDMEDTSKHLPTLKPIRNEHYHDFEVNTLHRKNTLLGGLSAFTLRVTQTQKNQELLISAIRESLMLCFSYPQVDVLRNENDAQFRSIWQSLSLEDRKELKKRILAGIVTPISPTLVIFPLKHDSVKCLLLITRSTDRAIDLEEMKVLTQAAQISSMMLQHAKNFETVELQAATDELTKLYNRRVFYSRLQEEINRSCRYGQSFALIMIDVDHFKKINDTYGHVQGDEILRGISKTLMDVTRTNDIVARLGGEEFVVLLPSTEAKGAARMAERIRKLIENRRFGTSEKRISVTVSGGVATYDHREKMSDQEFIHLVDESLYQAKALGRNRIVICQLPHRP